MTQGFRRFEYVDGGSRKFWEAKVEGVMLTVRFGRLGTAGQLDEAMYDSPGDAKRELKARIGEKLKKGYKEVLPEKAAALRQPELEAAIEKSPDDPGPYLVYADWLQELGDPRGELIALHHRKAEKPATKLLEKHREQLLGALAPLYTDERYGFGLRVEWRFGFMRRVSLGWGNFSDDDDRDVFEDLKTLVELPVARFIEALVLGPIPGTEEMTLQPAIDALVKLRAPATLRELSLGNTGDWDISNTATGHVDPLAKVFPRLEKLRLHAGSIGLGRDVSFPALRELQVQSGSLTKADLKALCSLEAPKLERLEVWFGDPNYGASGGVKDVAQLLAAQGFERVKHLGLMNCPFADELVKALAGSKILSQLTSLDLSMGALSDAGVDAMLEQRAAFAHLESLNLDDNALTTASKPKVKRLAKSVNFGKEQDPDRVAEGSRRYVSVGE